MIKPRVHGSLRVGNYVEIRGAPEIMATLDSEGCLEGLPFMPEMASYCGKRFRVFKRVDKVIDVVKGTGLRRMSRTVLLDDLRCDGHAHGGCQAGCQFLWKEDWLRRVRGANAGGVDRSVALESQPRSVAASEREGAALLRNSRKRNGQTPDSETYRCQATELYIASSYLPRWDLVQYLAPLWYGNINLWQFLSFASIKFFNLSQKVVGGARYPYWPSISLTKTPTVNLDLQPGELVYVKAKEEIHQTLDSNNRNRGLWFDHEMLRFCGGRYRVLRRVHKLIDEKTGKLRTLKNPCVILDGVTATGEFHRFYPQNDYPLWRDIWLRR